MRTLFLVAKVTWVHKHQRSISAREAARTKPPETPHWLGCAKFLGSAKELGGRDSSLFFETHERSWVARMFAIEGAAC
jgi:hypothetical protein